VDGILLPMVWFESHPFPDFKPIKEKSDGSYV
jgi:hypothetical protein